MTPWAGLFVGFSVGVLGTAGVARWLVSRHLRREREAQARARRVERLAEVGAMTAGLAHEIKNPLSTIGLNAQLLGEAIADTEMPDDERSRLQRRTEALRREVDRLKGILSDFLEYAGELRLDRRDADLNQVVQELADFFAPQADKHGVRVRLDVADPGPRASVDASQLKQAILNLMLNAVQAMADMPAGHAKELIVRTRAHERGPDGPWAAIHIIDTGPGMPPDRAAKVFEPYFTTKAGGTGLGLPTSRRLVEAHGGRLEMHSEQGRGTDFTIVIPLTPAA